MLRRVTALLLLGLCFVMHGPVGAQARRQRAPERPGLIIEPIRGIFGHLVEGPFQRPAGVYFDRHQKELLICDPGTRRIAIADDRGVPTFSFGSKSLLEAPRRVVVDSEGRIYVADSGHDVIRVFDYDGSSLGDLDLSELAPAELPLRAVGLALTDDEETLYVLDANNKRVIVTDLAGSQARAFGPPPGTSDLLRTPIDLDIAPTGELVISDSSGLAVQVYLPSGKFLRGWGQHEVGMSNFSLPSGLAVDGAGRIFVADRLRQDVKVFDANGDFITNFGGLGRGPGEMTYPIDVGSDRVDRIFVAESAGRRVQIFRVRDE
jgi:DNA-binding beta-propeller fold protein YncE